MNTRFYRKIREFNTVIVKHLMMFVMLINIELLVAILANMYGGKCLFIYSHFRYLIILLSLIGFSRCHSIFDVAILPPFKINVTVSFSETLAYFIVL